MIRFRRYWPILFLVCLPVVANLGILSGAFSCDPELLYSGLGQGLRGGLLPGAACFVDPAVAYITQPLGHLSAQDWLHGVVPWWNPFSGIGMPLAAEVQDEAFFLPFVLLLHFHAGWLVQRLLFEMLSGIFTSILLAELGLGGGALLGGALYALNGSFILTAGTVSGPNFCLPLLLLGIEHARRAGLAGAPMGWSLIALALAMSIYAGFPETAFLNGLLAAAWVLSGFIQMRGAACGRFLFKVLLGGGIGLLLTAPLLVPFVQYIAVANLGIHAGVLATTALSAAAAPLQMLPLFYGGLAAAPPPALTAPFNDMWVRIGGWYGSAPVLLALYALVSQRKWSPERYLLALWILLWQARYFAFPGVIAAFSLIPGMSSIDAVRYSTVSVEFAVFVLAAYGFDDLQNRVKLNSARLSLLFGVFALCLLLSVVPALKYVRPWYEAYPHQVYLTICYLICVAFVIAVLARAILGRRSPVFAAGLMIAGSVGMMLFTQISGLRAGHSDRTAVGFLKQHVGLSRFYTIGPLAPNFSAAYGIASINYIQLPVPKNWVDYIADNLFAGADATDFGGGQVGQADALRGNLAAYAAVGVRYVVADPRVDPFINAVAAPVGADRTAYAKLGEGEFLSGTVPAMPRLATKTVVAVSVVVGTFAGRSKGSVFAALCVPGQCATGHARLAMAADNAPFTIPLTPPLEIQAGQAISWTLRYGGGAPVAIWMAPDLGVSQHVVGTGPVPAGLVPLLTFDEPTAAGGPARVFDDATMNVYEIADAAPYAAAIGGPCVLNVVDRQLMNAQCAHPAVLLRRELFYPGWHAQANGVEVPIAASRGIFQQVALPAGASVTRFSYMPPYTHWSCAAALLALMFWLAASLRGLLATRRHRLPSNASSA